MMKKGWGVDYPFPKYIYDWLYEYSLVLVAVKYVE
jgi:hypothetical protein